MKLETLGDFTIKRTNHASIKFKNNRLHQITALRF
jgi:hypothetical protein